MGCRTGVGVQSRGQGAGDGGGQSTEYGVQKGVQGSDQSTREKGVLGAGSRAEYRVQSRYRR